MKSKVLFAFLILLLFPLLNACSGRELDSFSLVTALGIDKDEAGYMVTYQVLNPKAVASSKSVNESSFVIYTEKGNDLAEMESRATTQASKMMYFAHVRSVVIGEDVARDGLKDILDYFARSQGFRIDFYIFIAKGTTANQILSTMTTIEPVSGMKLYGSIKNSKNWWAQTDSLKMAELVNDINAKGKNPVLAGVELYEKTDDMDTIKGLEKSNLGKLKITDHSVFHDDKLIGWLNESESFVYYNIVGKTKNTVTSFVYDDNTQVSLDTKMKKTKIKVSLSDGKPIINVMYSVEMRITAETGDVDFTKEENVDKLIDVINNKFIETSKNTLVKVQQELKTDIFGFGECIHREYPKVWNELKDNWGTEFAALQVNFMIDTKIRGCGEILKPVINEGE